MPITYAIDRDRRLIVATVIGDFTTDDIASVIREAVADPAFEPGFNILSDHSAVGNPITPQQAERMIAQLRNTGAMKGARWAVVATRPASYGMMRLVSVLAEEVPITFRVFGSLADAEAWLAGPP